MFSFFRKGITAKLMLVVLGIALFALVVTGFGTPGGGVGGFGGGGDRIATVGGEPITGAEVTDQVNRQIAMLRRDQPDLDTAAFIAGGGYEEVVRQMIAQRALTQFASAQGLTASRRMVDGEIASIPAFRNLAGQFDEATFRRMLQSENITEQQLRDDLANGLIQRQLLGPMEGRVRVAESIARQYASLLLEQRKGSIGFVPSQAMGAGTPPSDADVQRFYKENQARYTIPERRVLRYATFGRDQIASAAQPTDAEIAAYYQSNQATYGASETRTLSQVVLPDQGAARALAQSVAGGTSFAAAAQQAGFSATDIAVGQQSKADFANLTSEAVANAAFAAAQGAITQPVRSDFGWHVVRVDSINPTAARPLATVREEIATQLAAQKAEEALANLVARVEDRLAEGATFDEVVQSENLQAVETPPLTGSGQQFDNPAWQPAPELPPLLRAGFEMGVDEDPVVETIVPNQRFAILDVVRAVPAAAPPIAQIRDRVAADVIQDRAFQRARAVATSIAAKVNAGTAPRAAFAEAEMTLPAIQEVDARRVDVAQAQGPVPPELAMLFSLPQGRSKILAEPRGLGWFVVSLAEAIPGDASEQPGLIQATRGQLEGIMGQEHSAQFARAAEAGLKITRDENAIGRVKNQLRGLTGE